MSLFKRKDSKYWWVKITIGGRKIQRSTGTQDKTLAREYHDRLMAEMWKEKRLGIKPIRSWIEAVNRWVEETKDKATHDDDKQKLAWLDQFLGDLMLDEIDEDVVWKVKSAKLAEASESTVNRYLALMRSILIRARDDWKWLTSVPKFRFFKEPNGRVRFLQPEQAIKLLSELPKHQMDLVLFALATGLRQGNVLKLVWSQVDLKLRHVYIEADKSKNNEAIPVPLNDIAMDVLQKQLGKHPERIFTYRGKAFDSANTKAWRKALDRAFIDNFRWHDLRHTWATWQRKAGTSVHELQKLGGWKSPEMVERYAHLAPDSLSVAASRLDGVFNGYDLATLKGECN